MRLAIVFFLVSIASVAICPGADAGFLLEPYGGYALGNESVQTKAGATVTLPTVENGSDSATLKGFSFGGRAGLVLDHFLILAGEYQVWNANEKFNLSPSSTNWNQNITYATLGFQVPRGFRFMGSYGFNLNVKDATLPPIDFKGSGYKITVGWCLMSDVAVNLEYAIYKLNDYSYNGLTGKVSDVFQTMNYSAAMITLSFPLELFRFAGGHGGGGGSSGNSYGGGYGYGGGS